LLSTGIFAVWPKNSSESEFKNQMPLVFWSVLDDMIQDVSLSCEAGERKQQDETSHEPDISPV
jgi:hypothetical protein